MKLSIGISPCPNDTFIFEAIYQKQIDLSPFEFEFIFEDVESLNKLSQENRIDILKMSYANYLQLDDTYVMLRSGGALGKGVGPLLIAKKKLSIDEINKGSIAIPGLNTTAHFLMQYNFPEAHNKRVYHFSAIEDAILKDEVNAGVIIHENRFTYAQKGLVSLMDLGHEWELRTDLPIPLGGIAVKSSYSISIQHSLNDLIIRSIDWAQKKNPAIISSFIKYHAQEMTDDVIRKHIDLYVNDYSLDLGHDGEQAVNKMSSILNPSKKTFILSR